MVARKRTETAQLKLRLKEPIRAKIARAAKKNGRSLNNEIAERVENSLRDDNLYGGPYENLETRHLVQALAIAITTVEYHTGKKWTEDEDTMAQAYLAMYGLLGAFGPWSPDALRKRIHGEGKKLPFDVARNMLRQLTDNEALIDAMTGVTPQKKSGSTVLTGQRDEESSS